jgi:hypothetical protein
MWEYLLGTIDAIGSRDCYKIIMNYKNSKTELDSSQQTHRELGLIESNSNGILLINDDILKNIFKHLILITISKYGPNFLKRRHIYYKEMARSCEQHVKQRNKEHYEPENVKSTISATHSVEEYDIVKQSYSLISFSSMSCTNSSSNTQANNGEDELKIYRIFKHFVLPRIRNIKNLSAINYFHIIDSRKKTLLMIFKLAEMQKIFKWGKNVLKTHAIWIDIYDNYFTNVSSTYWTLGREDSIVNIIVKDGSPLKISYAPIILRNARKSKYIQMDIMSYCVGFGGDMNSFSCFYQIYKFKEYFYEKERTKKFSKRIIFLCWCILPVSLLYLF